MLHLPCQKPRAWADLATSWFPPGQDQGAMWGLSKGCKETPKSATEAAGICSARRFSGCWGPAISLLSQKCFATSGSLGFAESLFQFFHSLSFWAVIQRRVLEANCFGLWDIHCSWLLCLRLVKVKMPSRLTENGRWIIFSHEHWRWLMNGFLPLQI